MANNRCYLVCQICLAKDETDWSECAVWFGKYYPSTGWTYDGGPARLDDFGQRHHHGTLFGDELMLVREDALGDPIIQAKRELMVQRQVQT